MISRVFTALYSFERDGSRIYQEQAAQLKKEDKTTLLVSFAHVGEFSQLLAETIKDHYYQCVL